MYVQRPVDFDSINYLPGFPTLSLYQCDPFSWNGATGGCAAAPVAVGRELAPVSDATSMALAVLQAQNKLPVRLGSSGSRSDRHRSRLGSSNRADRHLRGLDGCGCGGSCGGCGSPMGLGAFDWTSIITWLESNWMPLLVGGGVVWFLKRR
jgi:hypothetical protein